MSRVLLDTSAYIAFKQDHPGVKASLQKAGEVWFCPVVLGELLAGFMKGKAAARNQKDLRQFLASPRTGVLDMDADTAERYAVILNALRSAGTPVPTHDLWIAATAMQHGLCVLTTDSHFKLIPQILTDFHAPMGR